MKNYLTVAAILGAIAFVSVSFLAQAEPETSTVTTAVEQAIEEPASEAMVAPVADSAVMPVAEDPAKTECEASVASTKEDGTAMSAEERAAAVEKCVADKASAVMPAPAPDAAPAEKAAE